MPACAPKKKKEKKITENFKEKVFVSSWIIAWKVWE